MSGNRFEIDPTDWTDRSWGTGTAIGHCVPIPAQGDPGKHLAEWPRIAPRLAEGIEAQLAEEFDTQQTGLLELERRVSLLEQKVEPPYQLDIVALEPHQFSLRRGSIPVLLETKIGQHGNEEYFARFVEANAGSGGESVEEAITNLKCRLVEKFNFLDGLPPEILGDGPRNQLAVLKSVMARAT